MLTKNQIITALYTGKNFNDCLDKMQPEHLREDLKMEVILVVCEWSEEKVIKLHQDGALEFYVVRVILNQIQSKTSPFYKKYRQANIIYGEYFHNSVIEECDRIYPKSIKKRLAGAEIRDDGVEERQMREALEDFALEEIEKLHWYRSGLIKLFLRVGNYRAMEKEVGIPYSSCYKNIQQSITLLRSKVTAGECNPVFTKTEQRFIQNNTSILR